MMSKRKRASAVREVSRAAADSHVLTEEVVDRLSDILERGGNWLGHIEGYGWGVRGGK